MQIFNIEDMWNGFPCVECYWNLSSLGLIDLTFSEWERKLMNNEIAGCVESSCDSIGERDAYIARSKTL